MRCSLKILAGSSSGPLALFGFRFASCLATPVAYF